MTVDEAIHDLLDISTDVRRVAVLGPDGELLGAGPGAAGADVGAAAGRLWDAASRRGAALGEAPLDHVVVHDASGAVAVVREGDRRIAALTVPDPAVGLLLFDLRTCLSDAQTEETP
jgi:hypothetical protein